MTSAGTVTTTLQEDLYDAAGTRIRRTETDVGHDYYYANGALSLIDGPAADTVFLLAEDAPYSMVQGNDTYHYLTDLQGSVMAAMSGSVTAAVYSYTDVGETEEQLLESSFTNELCYTGTVYDRVTSLYYLIARYYDPATASFLSQDTYRGEKEDYEQWNLYAYCANDPINYQDPSGHLRIYTDFVAFMFDLVVTPYGVVGPFTKIKPLLKSAINNSAVKKKLVTAIVKLGGRIYKYIKPICKAVVRLIKWYSGLSSNTKRVISIIASGFQGYVVSKVVNKLLGNLDMFLSPGSLIANLADIYWNGYRRGYIWEVKFA